MKNENEDLYYSDITSYLDAAHISHTQKHKDFHILNFAELFKTQKLPMKVNSRKLGFFQIVTSNNHDADLTVDGTKFKDMKVNIIFIAPDQVVSLDVKGFKKGSIGYSLVFFIGIFTHCTFQL